MQDKRIKGSLQQVIPPLLLLALLGGSFVLTLAPTLTWAHAGGDGGDLISAAYTLGIAHPPGYPTYVLLGKLFTLLPVGGVAYRLNVMSAVGAIVAAGALYTSLVKAARVRPGAAFVAALCLGWSALVWSQAVIAEVYAPALAFAAVVWLLIARGGQRGWRMAALLLGLGLGMHLSMLLMLPALLWLMANLARPARGEWLWLCAALLAGAAIYIYIPLRAAQWPPIEWGAPVTPERFWWLASGQLYRGYLFALPLAEWPGRVAVFAGLLASGFTPLGVALAAGGLVTSAHRRWRMPLVLLFSAYALFALGYNTTDSYVYLLPAWFAVAFAVGLGADGLLAALPSPSLRRATGALLILLPAWLGWQGLHTQDLRSDHAAVDFGTQVMDAAAPGAVVVAADERHVFALWYFRTVAQRRTDLSVVASGLVGYDWYREQLAHAQPELALPDSVATPGGWAEYLRVLASQRAVYLADADPDLMQALTLTIEGPLWRVRGSGH